jgi:hypothetical protein
MREVDVLEIDLKSVFLVRPIARLPGGRTTAAVIIALALLIAFWVTGVFAEQSVGGRAGATGAALFLSAFIAYIIPIFGYIVDRTALALSELRDALDVDEEQYRRWQARLYSKPRRWLVIVLLIGASGGAAHNLLLFDTFGAPWLMPEYVAQTAVAVGTLLTWTIVTLAIAALIDNALLLNQAARHSRVEPFSPEKLRPFATVAVVSTLALIGAQAVFPVMFVDDDLSPAAYLPGMLATGIPMLLLALLPIWPVHQRIAATKRRLLDDLNRRIALLPVPDPDRPESIATLAPLLAYRRELRAISEWPFDVGVMTRLALILVIPPLTWVGAALVENLVEQFL